MKTTFRPGYAVALVALLGVGIGTVAWTGTGRQQTTQQTRDTIPGVRQKSSRDSERRDADRKYNKDLDKELAELDRAMKELEHMPKIDFQKMQAEVEASLRDVQESMARNKIDMEKVQRELQESLREITSGKIQKEMQHALRELEKVDMEKMRVDLEKAMNGMKSEEFRKGLQESFDKVDMEKIRKEIRESLREIDTEKMQKDIENAMKDMKKVDMEEIRREMEKVKEEMEKNKDNFRIDLQKAREDVLKAKEELRAYQQMIDEMESDGLINTREDYKIQFKNKELFINGKKQSPEIAEKYGRYFRKDITIQKEAGNMNINHYRNSHKEPA